MYGGINYTDSNVKGWTAPISPSEKVVSITQATMYESAKQRLFTDNPNSFERAILKEYESKIPWENFVGIPTLAQGLNSLNFVNGMTSFFEFWDNSARVSGFSREFGWYWRYEEINMQTWSEKGHPLYDTKISVDWRMNHSHPVGWAQPPSRKDIENSSNAYNRYVWGMGSQTLYIINSKGVIATIPFDIYFK